MYSRFGPVSVEKVDGGYRCLKTCFGAQQKHSYHSSLSSSSLNRATVLFHDDTTLQSVSGAALSRVNHLEEGVGRRPYAPALLR